MFRFSFVLMTAIAFVVPAGAADGLTALFDTQTHNFGDVAYGQTVVHSFTIKNTTNQTLQIGGLTNGSRRGRRGGRGVVQPFTLADAKPKRTRRPITDPEQIERRRQALAKARAARAEKLAAARGEATAFTATQS